MNKYILVIVTAFFIIFSIFIGCDSNNDINYRVTFNLEGGNINGDTSPVKIFVKLDDTINILPSPRKEGYNLDGWYTEQLGVGSILTDKTKIETNMTVYANWTPIQTEVPNYIEKTYKVRIISKNEKISNIAIFNPFSTKISLPYEETFKSSIPITSYYSGIDGSLTDKDRADLENYEENKKFIEISLLINDELFASFTEEEYPMVKTPLQGNQYSYKYYEKKNNNVRMIFIPTEYSVRLTIDI